MRILTRGVLFFSSCLLTALVCSSAPASAQPLRTGVVDPEAFSGPEAGLAFTRARQDAGANAVMLLLLWRDVAPRGAQKPADFNAADPASPYYSWGAFDVQVRLAAARGLQPVVIVESAPDWAEGAGPGTPGSVRPEPEEFHLFAKAAAERYDGDFVPPGETQSLPEVLNWQAWNEVNLPSHLMPQFGRRRRSVAPGHYRAMVNAFTAAAHEVDPNNVVIAGGTAPFGHLSSHAPLAFMRKMLCMSRLNRPIRGCRPARFDGWSHHPYTSGGPTHHAFSPDDVSLGDLPEMRRLLRAAQRTRHILSTRPVEFWVTEFSWDSRPPDRRGVPTRLHARWVAEALYRMWRSGVTAVVWWTIRDRPFPASPFQSGLFYCGSVSLADDGSCRTASIAGDAPKLALTAFRFPFVAFAANGRVKVWGRTPNGVPGQVVVERNTTAGWTAVGTVGTNSFGMFSRAWRSSLRRGSWRAQLVSTPATDVPVPTASVPFSLTRPADRRLKHVFGCGGILPC